MSRLIVGDTSFLRNNFVKNTRIRLCLVCKLGKDLKVVEGVQDMVSNMPLFCGTESGAWNVRRLVEFACSCSFVYEKRCPEIFFACIIPIHAWF